ncbi:hypothetical protein MTO96_037368 [Rhipicephalus appendiculatus]
MEAVLLKQFVQTYPQQRPSKVLKILELAYFRSGSSFLGQLLSANPQTFYHFEPLRTLPVGNRLYGKEALRGLDYITDFFYCDFTNHSDQLRLGMKYPHPFRQNTYLWSVCKGIKRVCLDAEFLNAVCKTAPIQVRFEDLALDTLNVTSKMYNALGLPLTTSVRQFIDSHTNEKNVKVQRHPYATSRNSKDVVNAWKRKIRPEHALHINRACGHVIKRLGYEL